MRKVLLLLCIPFLFQSCDKQDIKTEDELLINSNKNTAKTSVYEHAYMRLVDQGDGTFIGFYAGLRVRVFDITAGIGPYINGDPFTANIILDDPAGEASPTQVDGLGTGFAIIHNGSWMTGTMYPIHKTNWTNIYATSPPSPFTSPYQGPIVNDFFQPIYYAGTGERTVSVGKFIRLHPGDGESEFCIANPTYIAVN